MAQISIKQSGGAIHISSAAGWQETIARVSFTYDLNQLGQFTAFDVAQRKKFSFGMRY